jgi:hypothetical protein
MTTNDNVDLVMYGFQRVASGAIVAGRVVAESGPSTNIE